MVASRVRPHFSPAAKGTHQSSRDHRDGRSEKGVTALKGMGQFTWGKGSSEPEKQKRLPPFPGIPITGPVPPLECSGGPGVLSLSPPALAHFALLAADGGFETVRPESLKHGQCCFPVLTPHPPVRMGDMFQGRIIPKKPKFW